MVRRTSGGNSWNMKMLVTTSKLASGVGSGGAGLCCACAGSATHAKTVHTLAASLTPNDPIVCSHFVEGTASDGHAYADMRAR
jgi:hypothetical protein